MIQTIISLACCTLCIWGILFAWETWSSSHVNNLVNDSMLAYFEKDIAEELSEGNVCIARVLYEVSKKYGEIDVSGTPLDPNLIYNKGEEDE